jgi:hypothetical protein
MSAALMPTEEKEKNRPGYSFRVTPWGEVSAMVPLMVSVGALKCRSSI